MYIISRVAAIAGIVGLTVTGALAQSNPPNPFAAAQAQSAGAQPLPSANVTITKTKPRTIEIPAGTNVLVTLDRTLSSQTDKTDDTFSFTAAQDIVVKGMLVIAKGAPGQGHIINASKAGMFGKTGVLNPGFDWITAVDGEKIHVSGQQVSVGGANTESAVGASAAGALAGAVIPFAGLGSIAMGGKKAEIGTERPYPIYVADAVDVVSDKAAKIDDGFAHLHSDSETVATVQSSPESMHAQTARSCNSTDPSIHNFIYFTNLVNTQYHSLVQSIEKGDANMIHIKASGLQGMVHRLTTFTAASGLLSCMKAASASDDQKSAVTALKAYETSIIDYSKLGTPEGENLDGSSVAHGLIDADKQSGSALLVVLHDLHLPEAAAASSATATVKNP